MHCSFSLRKLAHSTRQHSNSLSNSQQNGSRRTNSTINTTFRIILCRKYTFEKLHILQQQLSHFAFPRFKLAAEYLEKLKSFQLKWIFACQLVKQKITRMLIYKIYLSATFCKFIRGITVFLIKISRMWVNLLSWINEESHFERSVSWKSPNLIIRNWFLLTKPHLEYF